MVSVVLFARNLSTDLYPTFQNEEKPNKITAAELDLHVASLRVANQRPASERGSLDGDSDVTAVA
jgi:hypothetical protein